MTRRIRVLHIVRNLNDGGMERVVADLARSLDPTAFDVHVMVLQGFGRFAEGAGVHTTLHSAPSMTKLSLIRPAALTAAIRDIGPDIVHTHSGCWYKVARASHLARVPLVYTDHGRPYPDPWLHRVIDRRAARLTDRVIAVSRPLGDYLVARLKIPREKVDVITNGIVLPEREAAPARGNGRPIVFGTLGRIEPVKGYDVLLAALARWPADAPRATLRIAGDGSQREPLQELVQRLRIEDRVEFVGWVDAPEPFYRSLDAFVLSSHSEGTSIGLLEAMAAGCPPIATDVGGNRDVLGAELEEWLVRPGDADGLAVKMARVARSADLRQRMATAARSRVATAYNLSRTAQQYATVYAALC